MSGAERQARYRAHKRGDHSLCDPDRSCDTTAVTVTQPVTRNGVTPPGLRARGRRMWKQIAEAAGPSLLPSELVLLEEACRIADRLDRMDSQINDPANTWLRFKINDELTEVTVMVDNLLSEARMQATALKGLLAELRQSRSATKPGARRDPGPATPASGGGGVVSLSERIAAKLAEAKG